MFEWWFIYGIIWFVVSAVVEVFNIARGSPLFSIRPFQYCGGGLSIIWYFCGWFVRYNFGGEVCAGDYKEELTKEELAATEHIYIQRSGQALS